MKLKYLALLLLLGLCTAGLHAQCILVLPPVNSTSWGTPLNTNFSCLNNILDGSQTITTLIATGPLQGGAGSSFTDLAVTGNANVYGNLMFPSGTGSTISTAGSAINGFLANRGYNLGLIKASISAYTITQSDCGNLLLFNNSAPVAITVPNANVVTTMCDIHLIAPIGYAATITASVSGQINSAAAYGASSFTIVASGDVELISNGGEWFVASVTTPGGGGGSGICSGLAANQVCGWNGSTYIPKFVDQFMNPATITGGNAPLYSPSAGTTAVDTVSSTDGNGNWTFNSVDFLNANLIVGASGQPVLAFHTGGSTVLMQSNSSLSPFPLEVKVTGAGAFSGTSWTFLSGGSVIGTLSNQSSTTETVAVTTATTSSIGNSTTCITGDGAGGVESTGAMLCLTGTTSTPLGGTSLTAGSCSTGTVSVSGATIGRPVAVSAADGSTLSAQFFPVQATVTAAGTVTVRICAAPCGTGGTPAAVNYNVSVM